MLPAVIFPLVWFMADTGVTLARPTAARLNAATNAIATNNVIVSIGLL